MPVNRLLIQSTLQKHYDRVIFAKDVLSQIFETDFTLYANAMESPVTPNKSESSVIDKVTIYANIKLEDGTDVICYEIILKPNVRIEYSKVAIQHYVRKLLTSGQAAIINFITPSNNSLWRLTLVAKDSEFFEGSVKEKVTNPKRYTFLLGPSESCKTAADRFESLSNESKIDFKALVNAFSVEKLSKAFFDEYTKHYQNFCNYLQESNFRQSVFKISFPSKATKEEKDKASKPIRDFTKKLLGRIVFLYFVQKKGWLGAGNTNYKDGIADFVKQLFLSSGANDIFYPVWLSKLFFETLNQQRENDDFTMPDGKTVKIPFLNGGLFDKEEYDDKILTFPASLFHNPENEDDPKHRGFLDFLDSFNFTVYEDSPDDHTVAVDPEMLGHIFENLLEDNKDKGAFYTPKEIVHYMCQESLIEYLATNLGKEYKIYTQIGKDQIEMFGNDEHSGQLKILEEYGDKALNKSDIANIVKNKDISKLTKEQLYRMSELLDSVKICDPAIGSGAFPMGLLQEIFSIKELIAYELNKKWNPSEVKLNIIQNSIYGVDIEKGAVDIARLRFWLSLIVNEEIPKALPNLDYKIVVGDSLVSKVILDGYEEVVEIDWMKTSYTSNTKNIVENIQSLLKEIANKQLEYFKATNKSKKKLTNEIRELKIELLINQISLNKEIYLSKTDYKGGFLETDNDIKYNTERKLKILGFDKFINKLNILKKEKDKSFNHFDWKLDFPEVLNPYHIHENSGFDIVIGNPPYINVENIDPNFRKLLFDKFETCIGRTDIYIAFLEIGLKIFKNNGVISFIVPYAYTNQNYGTLSRKSLIDGYFIKEILDTSNYFVFDSANVKNIILTIRNEKTESLTEIKKAMSSMNFISNTFETHKINQQDFLKLKDYRLETNNVIDSINLKNDIWKNSIQLEEICLIAYGARLNHKTKNLGKEHYISTNYISGYKKFTEGKNIERYTFTQHGWLNYKPKEHYNPMFTELFENEKIIFINVVKDKVRFAFDCNYFYNSHTVINCVKWNLLKNAKHTTVKRNISQNKIDVSSSYSYLFLLSVLNSKLINWYFKRFLSESLHFYPGDAKELPIPKVSSDDQKPFSIIISYILFLKFLMLFEAFNQSIFLILEQLIDGMVYELYFPELLKKHNIEISKHLGNLPEITDEMTDEQKISIIKKVYDNLNGNGHPVKINLSKLSSVPEIAIIEDK